MPGECEQSSQSVHEVHRRFRVPTLEFPMEAVNTEDFAPFMACQPIGINIAYINIQDQSRPFLGLK